MDVAQIPLYVALLYMAIFSGLAAGLAVLFRGTGAGIVVGFYMALVLAGVASLGVAMGPIPAWLMLLILPTFGLIWALTWSLGVLKFLNAETPFAASVLSTLAGFAVWMAWGDLLEAGPMQTLTGWHMVLAVGMLVSVLGGLLVFVRGSRQGLALRAMAHNPVRVQQWGVRPSLVRFYTWVWWGSFVGAVAGVLYTMNTLAPFKQALHTLSVTPFMVVLSLMLFMPLTLRGAVISGAFLGVLHMAVVTMGGSEGYSIGLAVLAVCAMAFVRVKTVSPEPKLALIPPTGTEVFHKEDRDYLALEEPIWEVQTPFLGSLTLKEEEVVLVADHRPFVRDAVWGADRMHVSDVTYLDQDIGHLDQEAWVEKGLVALDGLNAVISGLTVREMIFLAGHVRTDQTALKRDVDKVFEMIPDLKTHRDVDVGLLPTEAQLRLAMAASLISKPKVIMLDASGVRDPTGSLAGLVHTLNRDKGISILVMAPLSDTWSNLADRVYA